MRKQDHLLQLIASLSPNEKRNFTLNCSLKSGDKRYLQLFEALENKEQYNAAELSLELGIDERQLRDDKYYLNQALIRHLRSIDESQWQPPQFSKIITDVENLFSRGLPEPALLLIDKTLEDTRQFEGHATTLLLLGIKRNVIVLLRRPSAELKTVVDEVRKTCEAFVQYNELLNVCAQCESLAIERKNKKQLEELLKHPLLKLRAEKLLSVKAASCWFNAFQQVYDFLGDHKKLLEVTRRMVAYYQAHPQLLDIDARGYILGHISLAQVESFNDNYVRALELLDALKPFLHKPPKYLSLLQMESVTFYIKHTRAHVTLALGQYDESLKLGRELYRNKDTRQLHEQYNLIYEFGVALLQTNHSKDAYDKMEELIQMGDDIREDLQVYVRPLIILAQLDMEHFTLIPYLIKSAKSWMKRKKIDGSGLETFFHHAYAIAKAPEHSRQQAWVNMVEADENGELKALDEQIRGLKNWLTTRIQRFKRS